VGHHRSHTGPTGRSIASPALDVDGSGPRAMTDLTVEGRWRSYGVAAENQLAGHLVSSTVVRRRFASRRRRADRSQARGRNVCQPASAWRKLPPPPARDERDHPPLAGGAHRPAISGQPGAELMTQSWVVLTRRRGDVREWCRPRSPVGFVRRTCASIRAGAAAKNPRRSACSGRCSHHWREAARDDRLLPESPTLAVRNTRRF
jgi:hypothetical protein